MSTKPSHTLRQAAEGNVTARERAEEALRLSQESYRDLASQLLIAQEDERERLARELHDDLTQQLAVLAMEIEMLAQQVQSPQEALSARLMDLKKKLVELSSDAHAISRRLYPSILIDLGLADAIESQCAAFRQREGIVVNYVSKGIPREVPLDVALSIYRIFQEGLRNISKHAKATEVDVSFVCQCGAILLSIHDNGMGFDPARAKKKRGLGLASMKERVNLIRGDFSVQSQPGQGTLIEVLVPLSRRTP